MIRYLKTYTDLENWLVLKDSNVQAVEPVIEAKEAIELNDDATIEDIMAFKKIEREHFDAIDALQVDDKAILETMIHKILYKAYRLNYNHYARRLFVQERADDLGVVQDLANVSELIDKGELTITQNITHNAGTGDTAYYMELLDELLLELDEAWTQSKADIEHLSPTHVQFFETEVQRAHNRIERYLNHFKENVFGKWLLSLRNERGWSLARAEKETGVNTTYILRFEKGQYGATSFKRLRQLANGYHVPFESMVVMATEGVKPIQETIDDGVFKIKDRYVTPKQRYELMELFEHLITDDMVAAHQSLDTLAGLLSE